MALNPLLELVPRHGPVLVPFDRLQPAHVRPAIDQLLGAARARLAALEASTGPRTYATTLGELEALTEEIELAATVVSHLEAVATTPELREAHAAVQPDLSAFFTSITLSEGVYRALKEFAQTPEASSLSSTKRRLLEKTLAEMRRSGAELHDDAKRRLAEIDVELATVTLRFSQAVVDATNAFELIIDDASRLEGLPEQALLAARESAARRGLPGHRLTLQAPSYTPALTYVHDATVRERLYRANVTRAASGELDNRPRIQRILALRREKAELLGFANFADLVLEDRMAKTGGAARRFIENLRQRTEPFFARENEELISFRREIEGPPAPALAPWDVAYYAEKLRRARYDFDEEALRPYFSLERVLEGLFAIANKLYGVRVEPFHGAPVWHPDVRVFRLVEADGEEASLFYVDVAPREDKRDGAWMHGIVTAAPKAGRRHVEVLAANLTPALEGRPALLTHREVETLFHEFGHLLHHASSRVEVRALAGTSVAWDFVELPSQIMQNWCWEREAIDLFARHFETGAPVPDELFKRMKAARSFRAANAMMRQLGFAEVDLALHMDAGVADVADIAIFTRAILERYSPAPFPPEHAMIAGFTHLFASPVGYAAAYYSYKWAEVLDADAFSRFKEEGVFAPTVGASFRREILARGDSEDPAVLFRSFMGREPDLDALFVRDGLVSAQS